MTRKKLGLKAICVRIPENYIAGIWELAELNQRSFNSEIREIITTYFYEFGYKELRLKKALNDK